MSISMEPLKITPLPLHRFWFKLTTSDQWYAVIHECRSLYGSNWRCQRKVLKKFRKSMKYGTTIQQWFIKYSPPIVWFDVPDPMFSTWAAVKFSLEVSDNSEKFIGK